MTTRHPDLPGQAFLLTCCRLDGGASAAGDPARLAVRAAALVELWLGGRLVDAGGNAEVTGLPSTDPLLRSVLEQVAASRPRSWQHWVGAGRKATYRAVQDRLAAQQVVRLEPGRVLGLFPRAVVTVPDPRPVRDLVTDCRRAALGTGPVREVDSRLGALVALAWAAELDGVLSSRERRQHGDRIGVLVEAAGPAVSGLRKAVVALGSAGTG